MVEYLRMEGRAQSTKVHAAAQTGNAFAAGGAATGVLARSLPPTYVSVRLRSVGGHWPEWGGHSREVGGHPGGAARAEVGAGSRGAVACARWRPARLPAQEDVDGAGAAVGGTGGGEGQHLRSQPSPGEPLLHAFLEHWDLILGMQPPPVDHEDAALPIPAARLDEAHQGFLRFHPGEAVEIERALDGVLAVA